MLFKRLVGVPNYLVVFCYQEMAIPYRSYYLEVIVIYRLYLRQLDYLRTLQLFLAVRQPFLMLFRH